MNKCIAIGGIGGSGTRVVAQIVQNLGFFMGYDLNPQNDTLLFTLFFKRKSVLIDTTEEFAQKYSLFKKLMSSDVTLNEDDRKLLHILSTDGNEQYNSQWLQERVTKHLTLKRQQQKKWGWKEPNTHIVIDKLLYIDKDLKFIYVYRNGLDMAFSSNQNQLRLWGDVFLNQEKIDITPKNSLRYWVKVQQRMEKVKKIFDGRILFVNFDDLCKHPRKNIEKIVYFFNREIKEEAYKDLLLLPQTPSSTGRYKNENLAIFDKEDIAFVANYFPNILQDVQC